jgi:hypothetical protein
MINFLTQGMQEARRRTGQSGMEGNDADARQQSMIIAYNCIQLLYIVFGSYA